MRRAIIIGGIGVGFVCLWCCLLEIFLLAFSGTTIGDLRRYVAVWSTPTAIRAGPLATPSRPTIPTPEPFLKDQGCVLGQNRKPLQAGYASYNSHNAGSFVGTLTITEFRADADGVEFDFTLAPVVTGGGYSVLKIFPDGNNDRGSIVEINGVTRVLDIGLIRWKAPGAAERNTLRGRHDRTGTFVLPRPIKPSVSGEYVIKFFFPQRKPPLRGGAPEEDLLMEGKLGPCP